MELYCEGFLISHQECGSANIIKLDKERHYCKNCKQEFDFVVIDRL